MEDSNRLRHAASTYAAAGWPVLPLRPGTKLPATRHGCLEATTDPCEVAWWWDDGPDCNVGIATGAPGPDVVDVENTPSGEAAFDRLREAGLLAGARALVVTRSGGRHLYFRGTTGQRNAARIGGFDIDFRSTGGYVVAPPSYVDADGVAGRYLLTEHRAGAVGTFDLAAARSLLEPPRPPRRPGRKHGGADALIRYVAAQARDSHRRNCVLFWAACRAVESGHAGALDELVAAAVSNGLDEAEARRTVASAERKAGSS